MTHPFIGARQTLVATLLILMSLNTYGCGDTATVTEPAELGNLSVTDGTLEPAFNPATTSYIVQLPISVSSTTITAAPRIDGDTIRIDNQQITSQTVTLGSPGAEQTINIVVTETGTGGTSRSYTVRVTRATLNGNNSLNSLAVPPGTLAPEFKPDVLRYTASVANNIGSVNVIPTLSDPAATMTVNGQPTNSGQSRTINLNGGGQTSTITITITAQNGNPKSYEVVVSRGPSNNNNLRGLAISPGTLNFRANTTSYDVDVASNIGSVTVTPSLADTSATMTVNGQAATSGQARTITLNGPGSPSIITIIVIAQNGTPKPYSVNVARAALGGNNNLQNLTVSSGTLDPTFSANTTNYSMSVGTDVGSLTVTPTLQASTATMTVNGQPTNSGQARTITLNTPGSNTNVTIVVTAQNGTPKTYSVNVARATLGGNNNLSALTVSQGSLSPAFAASTLSYAVTVDSNVPNVTVSATKADPNSVMSEDVTAPPGTASGQATITLGGEGSTTPVLINVAAPNGNSKTYRINVTRAAPSSNNNLRSLRVRPGTLQPTFRAGTESYSVDVQSNVGEVTVTATKADPNAVISADVPNSGQATIQLDGPGTSKTITITVTAPNGNSKTYTITVNQAALGSNSDLSALTVDPGSLSFNANTLTYTVNVDSNVPSVAVSATKADPNAVISGDVPNSGQATIQLDGPGTSKTITITVTAPNGNSKNYTITVNQAAVATKPPAPTSAPNLIKADDSCPLVEPPDPNNPDPDGCVPGTSKTDNITNVNTPRFRIPPPGAGETPSLLVDGNKVSATFSGGNTLTPSASLSDGSHTIAYTLANSVGESDPGPSLAVTINTGAPVIP